MSYSEVDLVLCSFCYGSGEGRYEGWTCLVCNGTGMVPKSE